MNNFETAMRVTAMNLAIEFVQASDKDEVPFASTQDLIDAAKEIYDYITPKEEHRDNVMNLFNFEGDPQ